MGKEKLTDKQTQILEYIRHEILAKGYPPSIREICQAVDLKSTSSVHAQPFVAERLLENMRSSLRESMK